MPLIFCIIVFIVIYILLNILLNHKGLSECMEERKDECTQCVNNKSPNTSCPNCEDKGKKMCINCNNIINENWRYCPYCGNTKGKGD